MIRPAALLIAAAALAAAPQAWAQSPANSNPASAHAGAYTVEPSHTRIQFRVSHMGFTTWWGDFTGASGRLTLDPARPGASAVEVSVPTASVSTTNATLDGELKGPEWLDAAKFPQIGFRSTSVTRTGADTADVAGQFTLHGVTRPLVLHARFNGAGVNPLDKHYTVGFEATGRIKRSDFGVSKYVPLVGDEVAITVSAAFEQPGA